MQTTQRLKEVITRLHEELKTIEERRTQLKHTIGTFDYIMHGRPGSEMVSNSNGSMNGNGHQPRHMSVKGRKAIRKAQRARWAKVRAANKSTKPNHAGRALNALANNWNPKEDKRIITVIGKRGPIHAVTVSQLLAKKMKDRTVGAIRQRITRLSKKGLILDKKIAGTKVHTVEANNNG